MRPVDIQVCTRQNKLSNIHDLHFHVPCAHVHLKCFTKFAKFVQLGPESLRQWFGQHLCSSTNRPTTEIGTESKVTKRIMDVLPECKQTNYNFH